MLERTTWNDITIIFIECRPFFQFQRSITWHILDIPAPKKPGFKPGFCFFSPEPGFASPEQILPAPKPGFGGKASGLDALIGIYLMIWLKKTNNHYLHKIYQTNDNIIY